MSLSLMPRRLHLIFTAASLLLCLGVEVRAQAEEIPERYQLLSKTMHHAKQAMKARDWEKTVTLFEKYLEFLDVRAAEAFLYIGIARSNQGDVEAAKAAFRKCSALRGPEAFACKKHLELLGTPWGQEDPPPELRDPFSSPSVEEEKEVSSED